MLSTLVFHGSTGAAAATTDLFHDPPPLSSLEWVSEDVDGGFSPLATGAPLDLQLDSKQQPHIFYSAAFEMPHQYLYAHRQSDGSWIKEVVDVYDSKYGTFDADTHLVIDKDDHVHVLYTKEGTDPEPCAGCSDCDTCSGATPRCCASDPNCCDAPMWGELWYAVRDVQSGNWTRTLVDRGYRLNETNGRPMDCSLALDDNGNPHVAYYLERPTMQLWWASPAQSGSWSKELVATDGGYDNHLVLANGYPIIIYWSENCFCVRIWAQAPDGQNVTGTVGEGPNSGASAQGYGISTALSNDSSELLVSFTRNVYSSDTARVAVVPLEAAGGVGTLPNISASLDKDTARASPTAITFGTDNMPAVAFSYGTADGAPFEVHTAFQTSQSSTDWTLKPVPATLINSTGGLDGAAALGLECCDDRGLPVLAYTRRPSIYESYLAYATLQVSNATQHQHLL